jgi:hypothetical protein
MAIRLSSDLVLDVARAADPARVAKAVSNLNNGVESTQFASAGSAGGRSGGMGPQSTSFASFMATQGAAASRTSSAPIGPQAKAARELETLLLQQMIEAMLPKEGDSAFGKGTAGSVWRSMLAEHVARNVASSGQVGLEQVLTRDTTGQNLKA